MMSNSALVMPHPPWSCADRRDLGQHLRHLFARWRDNYERRCKHDYPGQRRDDENRLAEADRQPKDHDQNGQGSEVVQSVRAGRVLNRGGGVSDQIQPLRMGFEDAAPFSREGCSRLHRLSWRSRPLFFARSSVRNEQSSSNKVHYAARRTPRSSR